MLRPANVSIVLALLLIWWTRVATTKKLPLTQLMALGLGLSIPFIPQLANNYRTFHEIQPTVVGDLRQEQLRLGARFLKYGTVVIGDEDPQLCYDNPFIRPNISKPADFLRKQPVGYALTLLLHGFALLDQDFPFPYIRDLHPWYRWPSSILNYVFSAGVTYGIILALRRFARTRRVDKETFAALAILMMSVCYLALYIPCDPENRFSLPLLLLWSPFFVNGLLRLRLVLACRCYRATARAAVGLVVFVGCCIWLSSWMQLQAPRLRHEPQRRASQLILPDNRSSSEQSPELLIGKTSISNDISHRYGIHRVVPWDREDLHAVGHDDMFSLAHHVEACFFQSADRIQVIDTGQPRHT
jgi:hypothetical protein